MRPEIVDFSSVWVDFPIGHAIIRDFFGTFENYEGIRGKTHILKKLQLICGLWEAFQDETLDLAVCLLKSRVYNGNDEFVGDFIAKLGEIYGEIGT